MAALLTGASAPVMCMSSATSADATERTCAPSACASGALSLPASVRSTRGSMCALPALSSMSRATPSPALTLVKSSRERASSCSGVRLRSSMPQLKPFHISMFVKSLEKACSSLPAAAQPYSSWKACTIPPRPYMALSHTPVTNCPLRTTTRPSCASPQRAPLSLAPASTFMGARPRAQCASTEDNSCFPVQSRRGLRKAGSGI
mmetsp:Transcript_14556/g.60742  ORF Transcript_14556/g.60742 Transcript_14556/m.60742 type:complete len:204 (+) Transcript_14556:2498-3109(+)